MTEIASDLSLSKALLYYYFPDKLSLYCAVLNSIVTEMDKEIKTDIGKTSNCFEAVDNFLKRRHDFLTKYYNLLDFTKITGSEMPSILYAMFNKFKAADISTVTSILSQGVDKNDLALELSQEETAALLLDALKGIAFEPMHSPSRPFFPEKEEFQRILKRQSQLAKIFVKGLTAGKRQGQS